MTVWPHPGSLSSYTDLCTTGYHRGPDSVRLALHGLQDTDVDVVMSMESTLHGETTAEAERILRFIRH